MASLQNTIREIIVSIEVIHLLCLVRGHRGNLKLLVIDAQSALIPEIS